MDDQHRLLGRAGPSAFCWRPQKEGSPTSAATPGAQDGEAIGRSRAGLSTKIHLAVDGRGRPLSILLTPGQAGDNPQLLALPDAIRVNEPGPGRPRKRPDVLIADKGYAHDSTRRALRQRGVRHVIPERSDHGDNGAFLRDYGKLDLSAVAWTVEATATQEFLAMPTGRSDGSCIDEYAADPNHWISVRQHGVHAGVSLCWATHGTWKRWPILVDRSLVDATAGLQVVEGRTRVGILRGRHRENDRVAPQHLAWVGRPTADPSQTA